MTCSDAELLQWMAEKAILGQGFVQQVEPPLCARAMSPTRVFGQPPYLTLLILREDA